MLAFAAIPVDRHTPTIIMATGGIPKVSVKGSDEFYLFMCSPCSRKDLDVGAEVYCLQCEEYLCGKCHRNHNNFAKMAAHTMLDRAQMEAKGPQPVQPLLTVPCDLHPGQVYTLFCDKHNQVCCPTCYPINHRSCDVKYIFDAAKGTTQGQELGEFRRAVKTIRTNLEKVKKQRECDMQRLAAEKDAEINKIHTTIQQIIKQLEVMEKTAANKVTRKFTEFKAKIENDLTKLATIINTLNTKLDKLEKAKDDTEKFIHMKICEGDKTNARKMIEDIEARVGDEKLVFLIDERVEESVRKLQSLGQLVQDYRYTVTPEGQYRVDTKKNEFDCNINDISLAEDGSLLMTDWENSSLKRLDQNYKFIDRLDLEDSPQGVCSISASQVAVCICFYKRVQIVTLNPAMTKSGSFKTTDRCRGIAYHADHLYVACGGVKREGPGHIAVYTISGTLVRKLESDSRGQLFSSFLLGITVRRSDGVILACDRDKGLVALRPDGQQLWTITLKDLDVSTLGRVIVDSHEQALVSSMGSNKVVLVSRAGRKLGDVLTARDGIDEPVALCYIPQRSHLAVGMDRKNQIKCFKLE